MKAKFINELFEESDWDPRIQLEKDLKNSIKLYEGLTKSYDIKDTIRYFSSKVIKHNKKGIITYSFIDNNKALPYIRIKLKEEIDKSFLNEIINSFKVCGWELATSNLEYLIFRAKFDVEVKRKTWPDKLYHITPLKNKNRITKYGLVPKSGNKKLKHEDAIYFYSKLEDTKILYNELKDYTEINKYILLEIEMVNMPRFFKLFRDPDKSDAYFTKDNVSIHAIKFLKEINK